MRILTSERCPHCTQVLWMEIDAKIDDQGKHIVINGHGLGANVYLDHNGVLNVVESDLDVSMPTYHCHFCGFSI